MLRLVKLGLLYILSIAVVGGALADDSRVALVVGNGAYEHTTKLANAPNDARVVSEKLKKLGFDVVTGMDLGKLEFRNTLRTFARQLQSADVAVLFYAGHGLQVSGINYLVPVDANIVISADLQWEAVSMQTIMNQMEGLDRTSIVILDACRDNPLSRRLARTLGARSSSVGRGLARIVASAGSFVAFATSPNDIALDGQGSNSPFSTALAKYIETPELDISQLFRRVRVDVENTTSGQQIPWSNSSLRRDFQFNPNRQTRTSASPAAKAFMPIIQQYELAHWNAVKDSDDPPVLETFLEQYPSGRFAKLAKLLVEKAKRQQAQIASIASEEQRSGSSVADGETRAPNSRVATAPPLNAATDGDATAPAAADTRQLARSIQRNLQRLGCNPGSIDGLWGGRSRNAMRMFNRRAKAKLSIDGPTQEAARILSAETGRVCRVPKTKKPRRALASARGKKSRSKRSNSTSRKPSSSSSGSSSVSVGVGAKRGGGIVGIGLSF